MNSDLPISLRGEYFLNYEKVVSSIIIFFQINHSNCLYTSRKNIPIGGAHFHGKPLYPSKIGREQGPAILLALFIKEITMQ